jgi:sulfhydrogenase subunit alpha
MKRTITVNHLARVEGHGGITVELDGDRIGDVRFDIFEGMRLVEGLVRGRSYEDVSQIVSRICAICSVAHSLCSIKATENAFGIVPSVQTELLRDLMYRGENIESHALHLFFLAAPDYLGYPSAIAMAEKHPDSVALGLRLKKLGNAIQETIGGRAVHPVNAVVGGFGSFPAPDRLIELQQDLQQAVGNGGAVVALLESLPPADFCDADTSYAAMTSMIPYGYYRGDEIQLLSDGGRKRFAASDYRRLTNEAVVPHSHAKHSRHDGRPFMTGALARLAVNRDVVRGTAADALERLGVRLPSRNPMDNNKAQAVELLGDLQQALDTVDRLIAEGIEPEAPAPVRPRAGTGTAVTEAPRGLLFHSYTYDDAGRVTAADVITPTALNAASIEDHFRRAAEQAEDRGTEALQAKLQMIARAYDPCISCSVHLVRKEDAS